MENNFEPELGHAVFGQPWKQYKASSLLLSAIHYIDNELGRAIWNVEQREYQSPFENTGSSFECPSFHVCAYCWDESREQAYNFKWKDVEISWYKYVDRDTSVNQILSNDKISEMLDDCINAILKFEKESIKKQ